MATILCQWCKKSFEPIRKTSKYCSIECRAKSREKQVLCICKICGKKFSVKFSWFRRGGGQYCSRKCSNKGLKKPREKRKCLRCKKVFLVGGQGVKDLHRQFCSTKCALLGIRFPRIMTKIERAWFAGLFDGEGNITIDEKNRIKIAIYNTNKELINKVYKIIQIGGISIREPRGENENICYIWQAYSDNAKLILKQIYSWLIVKREKAQKILSSHRRY